MIKGALFVIFPVCSLFLPFAFAMFVERNDFREALEFELILHGIKQVLLEYIIGYIATIAAIYASLLFMRIPLFDRLPYIIGPDLLRPSPVSFLFHRPLPQQNHPGNGANARR
jgi:hypothetical protein